MISLTEAYGILSKIEKELILSYGPERIKHIDNACEIIHKAKQHLIGMALL